MRMQMHLILRRGGANSVDDGCLTDAAADQTAAAADIERSR